MLWEVERILTELKEINDGENHLPQVLLMENVSQIVSKSNGNAENFKIWTDFLESLGYSNFFQKLNSRYYGVPQNRERAFLVSVLGTCTYKFPKQVELRHCVRNILEDEVDEMIYQGCYVNDEPAIEQIKFLNCKNDTKK